MKVILIGPSHSGKTTLLLNYVNEKKVPFVNSISLPYSPTIGVDLRIVNHPFCQKIYIWDMAGHSDYYTITLSYYHGTTCCFIVINLNNYYAISTIEKYIVDANMLCNKNEQFQMILFGTMADLTNQLNKQTIANLETIQQKYHLLFYKITNYTPNIVNEIIHSILKKQHNCTTLDNQIITNDSIDQPLLKQSISCQQKPFLSYLNSLCCCYYCCSDDVIL